MLGRLTVGLLFLLLVWGNLVAGMKAGLGCPDWPLCHGRVVPPFGVDIYMEYMHRVIAATATCSLLALAYSRFKAYSGAAKGVPVASVALVGLEVVLGGMVVLLGLPMQLTTVHFMTGLAVFLLAFYMMSFDGVRQKPGFTVAGPAGIFLGLGLVVFMQAALGAYVRHSGAGLACPDFPYCLGSLFPNLIDSRVLAHFSHRLMAYLILLSSVALYAFSVTTHRPKYERDLCVTLVLLVLGQVAVGAVVVLTGLYYLTTALHLAVALSILLVLGIMWVDAVNAKEASS